jgi:hypothetical protein
VVEGVGEGLQIVAEYWTEKQALRNVGAIP